MERVSISTKIDERVYWKFKAKATKNRVKMCEAIEEAMIDYSRKDQK